jgi:branched-chain amino acid transport system substrate-binding protein
MGNTDDQGWLTRRNFIRSAAVLGIGGGLLAACGDSDDDGGDAGATTTAAAGATTTAAAAASTTAAAGATTTAAAAAGDIPPLRIGFVTPRTGPLAAFGEADEFVLAQMRAVLGSNVEILDRDAESDSARAGEVTQELISEGVDVIVAGDTPDISVPVAAACDLGEVPCITSLAPWQPHYLGTGGALGPDVAEPPVASEWNYHFFWGLEDVIENFVALWEQSGVEKIVGAMWPNDPDGNAWGDPVVGFPPALEAAGFTLVDAGRFDLTTQDYSAIISQFKDAGVQIVSGVVPPPVFATWQAQALQQDFNPPVVTMAKALLFPSAVESYPHGEGLSTEIWWTNRSPFTSSLTGQTAGELAAAFEEQTGAQWTQPIGFAHALFEVAVDAAKRAGTAEKSELIAAIGATNLATVIGPVDFSSGPVPNVTKTPLAAGQWVAGQTYPLELAINVNPQLPDLPVDGEIQPITYS